MSKEGLSDPRGTKEDLFYLLGIALCPFLYFWSGTRMELMLGDGDAFVQFLPFWKYAADGWRNLIPPFWTPYIFGGYPLLAEPQASIFHPLKVLFICFSPLVALNLTVLSYSAAAGLFTYGLAREEGLTREAAFFAGLIFPYCGFLLGHQGITALFITAASTPLFFYVLARARRRPTFSSVALGAFSVLVLVLGGHPQFVFLALFFALFYALHLFLLAEKGGDRKAFAASVAGIYLLGILLSSFQLLPTWELTQRTVRSEIIYEQFVDKSMSPYGLFLSLVSTRLHSLFPNDGSEDMFNVGPMVLVLAILGVGLGKGRGVFWAFLALWCGLLVLGDHTPLYRLMYWIPGYNLFRLSSRNGLLLDFSLILLAAHALSAMQQRVTALSRRGRVLTLVGLPVAYLLGFVWMETRIFKSLWRVAAESGGALPYSAETFRRHLLPLAPEMLVLLAASGGVIFLLARHGRGRMVVLLCTVLAFSHLWSYRHWLFAAPASEVADSLSRVSPLLAQGRVWEELTSNRFRMAHGGPSNWIHFLWKDRQSWRQRYTAAAGVDLNLLQGIPSISGYTPLIFRHHVRLAGEMHMSGAVQEPAFFSSPALQLLNVKYVLVPPEELGYPPETFAGLEKLGEEQGFTLYGNPSAPGLFWAAERARPASEEEFWRVLEQGSVDFRRTALWMDPPPGAREERYGRPRRLDYQQVDPNTVQVEVESSEDCLLVASLLHYPGWFCWLDGEKIPILRVNGFFSAVRVPAGSHRLVFRFIPMSFWAGLLLSLLSLASFLWLWRRRQRRAVTS